MKSRIHPRDLSAGIPWDWPRPLGPAAMQGLTGEIVRTLSPHIEGDPAALFMQLLIAFGSVIGRSPHFLVGATRHGTNLFGLLVGETARAGKGSSWDLVCGLFRRVDPFWADECVLGGLSTGQGLIAAAAGINNANSLAPDHRFLYVQDEFSELLRLMAKYASTLSTTLRLAWDGRPLRVMTKEQPLVVKDAHVSLIGHITTHDLARYLKQEDLFNGFSNRILWTCARRWRLLPTGGTVPEAQLNQLATKLKKAVDAASGVGETGLSRKAWRLWKQNYRRLSETPPGASPTVDAATARAAAQTRRLALLFALLDQSSEVKLQHLRAALEVWRYCLDSARFVLGRATPTLEDKILRLLSGSTSGLTRTDISKAFSHHREAHEMTTALENLREAGAVKSKSLLTAGRSSERWRAVEGKGDQ